MPDLLLELFSEEIPARMQRRAADDLRKLVTDALVEAGFVYEGAKAFVTPRRLALTVSGIPARSADISEEKKGPRVGAPEAAIAGFLKGAGLSSIAEAKIQPDKKGDFYIASIRKPGRAADAVLAEALPKIIREFPWPKSMRWGAASAEPGSLRWVRPLHAIVATFGPETEDPEVIRFDVGGVAAGDTTFGHRFMAPAPIRVKRFDDYEAALSRAKVVLDPERRKDIILHDARDRALALGLELIEDDALLDEVAGLNEWPVVLVGSFDEAFLAIPPEVIRTTIRVNQKCFVLRDPATGKLANRFVLTANIEAEDGGREIVAGNERVIRSRLSDAKYFWETDQRDLPDFDTPAMRAAAEKLKLDLSKPLDQRMAKLAATNVVFHEKLGTQGERVERLVRLAGEIADTLSARPGFFGGRLLTGDDLAREQREFRRKVERAAVLAKSDLPTEMVGEFPELQGLMGRYYATAQGEDPSVAAAIEDHYKPQGPGDRVPTDPVSIAVALADKLDILVGFWAIDEKPTGSKDPYALRRAALGVIRIVLENNLRLQLPQAWAGNFARVQFHVIFNEFLREARRLAGSLGRLSFHEAAAKAAEETRRHLIDPRVKSKAAASYAVLRNDLLAFLADRLKVQLREQGARHDLVDAVFALGAGGPPPRLWGRAGEGDSTKAPASAKSPSLSLPHKGGEDDTTGAATKARVSSSPGATHKGGEDDTTGAGPASPVQDDLLLIVRRVEALGAFLDSEAGKHLLAGYRRATNILRDEEKKSGQPIAGETVSGTAPEEIALHRAIGEAEAAARSAVATEDFAGAMAALATLRGPVDAFFEKVLVNDPDPATRQNRLRLLNRIREATLTVADFSKVGG